jgi:hypothetical protein
MIGYQLKYLIFKIDGFDRYFISYGIMMMIAFAIVIAFTAVIVFAVVIIFIAVIIVIFIYSSSLFPS